MSIVVMGVTGCGKTTVGKLLATKLGWQFYDADDFHPEENVEKMRAGIALTDEDRSPWLRILNEELCKAQREDKKIVLACSALKKSYRNALSTNLDSLRFVFLEGDSELIATRLIARTGHYMNPALLESQFATLEQPDETEENVILCNVGPSPEAIVEVVVAQFQQGLEYTTATSA